MFGDIFDTQEEILHGRGDYLLNVE